MSWKPRKSLKIGSANNKTSANNRVNLEAVFRVFDVIQYYQVYWLNTSCQDFLPIRYFVHQSLTPYSKSPSVLTSWFKSSTWSRYLIDLSTNSAKDSFEFRNGSVETSPSNFVLWLWRCALASKWTKSENALALGSHSSTTIFMRGLYCRMRSGISLSMK